VRVACTAYKPCFLGQSVFLTDSISRPSLLGFCGIMLLRLQPPTTNPSSPNCTPTTQIQIQKENQNTLEIDINSDTI
jgi:hypothetical protein